MKTAIWFVILFCLPIWAVNAVSNSVVLAPSNIESAPIQKISSSTAQTSLEFRMAGIESDNIELSGVTGQKVTPITSTPEKFGEIAEVGMPDLPILTQLVAIPDQAGVTAEIISSSYEILDNYDIMPAQPLSSDNSTTELPFAKNEPLYQKNEFYPSEIVQLGEPVIMRDLRMIQTIVNPVQYNPVTKQLKVYTDIQYRLNYSGTDSRNIKVRRSNYISEGFLPIYQALVPNADEMLESYEPARGGYVIIAKAALVDSLKAVALWKHQKGYISRIVPTTEITPGGSPTYTQIFNYLRTAYQTWDVPPEYVMLVGDVDGSFPVADFPYSSYPSDNGFACVDGTDYIPDIFIARMSVDAMLDFRIAISKIFKYEKTPLMRDPEHWVRGLSVGYTYYNTSRLTTLWVRQLALQNGFSRVDTVYGSSVDPRVITYMNNGPGMIWYRGAGDDNHWWGPELTISNLNAMPNNQKLGVMTPLTCGLGDFGTECFGETWIRMGFTPDSLKGGPAFFGVSDHFTHTKWNNPIMVGYFDGIFELGIYHFAAAAVAGKLQMYRTFPGNPSGMVQQYFNTYNMLGDPELEIRTKIPQRILVDHPHVIPFGSGYITARVTDTLGMPIEGAIITIIKGHAPNEEIFKVDKSDANGNVEFTFEASTPDTILITASGRNLYPYQGYILMNQADFSVGLDSLYIVGGDSIISPNESIQLGVVLKNVSSVPATGVRAALEPRDAGLVNINDIAHFYGNIFPGQQGFSSPFNIHIDPAAANGAVARIRIESSDFFYSRWESGLDLTITAPKLIVSSATFPGGNGRLDPGETCNLNVTLSNQGDLLAQGVTSTLISEDPFVSVTSPNASFGNITIGGSASNSIPMAISCSAEAYNGRVVNLHLHTVTSDGIESDVPFSAIVGLVASTEPMGPDRYGYYMYDNTDVSNALHPTYSWIELAPGLGGSGTRLSFSGGGDDQSLLVQLPFSFVYYGQTFGRIIVCSNGFISPDTVRMDMAGNYWANFFNWPIPDPGNARAQISPFWDDLQVNSTGNYGVFTWSDTTNHRFVIEWSNTTHRNTSAVETFEMVIYNPAFYPTITGDAEMLFQYSAINNNDTDENYATVGIESWDEQIGLQYTFDNIYTGGAATLANGRAIKITTNNNRGSIRGIADLTDTDLDSGIKVSASNGSLVLTSSSGQYLLRDLAAGTYSASAEMTGYFKAAVDNIQVLANQSAQGVNFALDPCPIPTNLVASEGLTRTVELNWTGVSHPDLTGYNVYRSLWENGEYLKLNASPVIGASYSDSSLTDSSLYWYYVTAAFTGTDWTSESKPSNRDEGTLAMPVGAIGGIITERNGTTPISGAVIRGLSGGVEIRRDTTDDAGLYNLPNFPFTLINLEASKIGYINRTLNGVQIVPGDTIQVNLTLRLEGSPSCEYTVGDANANGSFNGVDVVYSVSYFKGGNPPPYSCECTTGNTWFVAGDVNSSCNFNGVDVTYMVSYFKGGPVANPCADCPPARLLIQPVPPIQSLPVSR